MEKRVYTWLLSVLVILAISLLYFYKPHQKKDLVQTQPVFETIKPHSQQLQSQEDYVGYISSINAVEIIPYIAGFVEKIMVSGGQVVKAGDSLVLIKPNEYKANLDLSNAKLSSAKANYNNAKIHFDRIKKAGTRAVSKTVYDDAKTSFENASAKLKQAKANLDLAQINLDYTLIKAPFDGVVGNIDLSIGDYVSPQSNALFKIVQYNPIRVVFSISDKEFLQNSRFISQPIQLRLANDKIYKQIGMMKYSDNEINKSTNTIAVYAEFENPNKELIAGAYVDVIVQKTFDKAIKIPQDLVIMKSDGNFLKILKNDQTSLKKIEVLATAGNEYIIQNNFTSDEEIITGQQP